jgi:hypothetical protein
VLTNFCEGQNAYLSKRFIDVLGDRDKCSEHGLLERYPASGCRGARRSLFGPYLYNRSDEFDDLLFLNGEFVVP